MSLNLFIIWHINKLINLNWPSTFTPKKIRNSYLILVNNLFCFYNYMITKNFVTNSYIKPKCV